jgi:AraC-like DNA-binding protein
VELALLAAVAAAVGAGIGAALAIIVERRTRRQIDALMARLDVLENRPRTAREASVNPPDSGPGASVDPAGAPADDLSRDVLAGRTSFVRRAVGGELTRPVSLAGQAIALVHARIQDNLAPAELASELAISLRTLERGIAAELDCTPRQLILAMRMREARQLLESGRFRVNEVATRMGFASASHFSRSFRAFYRVPPSAWTPGSRS